jgi:hypothetical protein
MIKRSFCASALITGLLLSGVLAAPAFAQSYGVKPRGYCPPAQQTSRAYYSPAPVQMMYQPAQIAGDSAPAPERSRSRKGRGFPSPF